jgi:hypothetical protein
MVHHSKRDWARSRRLAEIAEVSIPHARNYLVTIEEDKRNILDSKTVDRRSPHLRTLITGCQAHPAPKYRKPGKKTKRGRKPTPAAILSARVGRASEGDPSKPPRAGAPRTTLDTEPQELLAVINLAEQLGGLHVLKTHIQHLEDLVNASP